MSNTSEEGSNLTHADAEKAACVPYPVNPSGFNQRVALPHGLASRHVHQAMNEFLDFLGFVNQQLNTKGLPRLEFMMMPANFSSLVGEFMAGSIPKYCNTMVRNKYHNGYPDLIPAGRYAGDSVLRADEGIEIKASRYGSGWQGHNPEDGWLMIFVFKGNKTSDEDKGVPPIKFQFLRVLAARLSRDDWIFSGRSGKSRRTITASVTQSGYTKLAGNWVYKDPGIEA